MVVSIFENFGYFAGAEIIVFVFSAFRYNFNIDIRCAITMTANFLALLIAFIGSLLDDMDSRYCANTNSILTE